MLKFVILQSIWRSTGVLGDCTGLLGGVMNVGEAGVFGIPSNCRAGGVGQLGFGVLESVGDVFRLPFSSSHEPFPPC